jgi:hypothetical protein
VRASGNDGGNTSVGTDGTRWPVRKWTPDDLERCTVAALADAHKLMNRPSAKTDRIAFTPFGLRSRPCSSKR